MNLHPSHPNTNLRTPSRTGPRHRATSWSRPIQRNSVSCGFPLGHHMKMWHSKSSTESGNSGARPASDRFLSEASCTFTSTSRGIAVSICCPSVRECPSAGCRRAIISPSQQPGPGPQIANERLAVQRKRVWSLVVGNIHPYTHALYLATRRPCLCFGFPSTSLPKPSCHVGL